MDRGAWQAAYSPWGRKESDMTEGLSFPSSVWLWSFMSLWLKTESLLSSCFHVNVTASLHLSRIIRKYVVQLFSCVRLFVTSWTAAHHASLPLTISWSLPRFMSIVSVMPSSHLIIWLPLLLPSVFPSIRDFSNESTICIRWPKYWSFNFTISPSNEYSGLISFKINWFDLLAVQGTLFFFLSKGLLIREYKIF